MAWHDGLEAWPEERVREESGRAHAAYEGVFGSPAKAAAAAGWTVSPASLAADEERGLLYTSNSRGGKPFFPRIPGRVLKTLEIPSTLPTLDETLAWDALSSDEDQRSFFRGAVRGDEVHTLHAEVEGRSKLPLFTRILSDWREAGAAFPTLADLAREALADPGAIPVRAVTRMELPGRAGPVATGWPAPAAPVC